MTASFLFRSTWVKVYRELFVHFLQFFCNNVQIKRQRKTIPLAFSERKHLFPNCSSPCPAIRCSSIGLAIVHRSSPTHSSQSLPTYSLTTLCRGDRGCSGGELPDLESSLLDTWRWRSEWSSIHRAEAGPTSHRPRCNDAPRCPPPPPPAPRLRPLLAATLPALPPPHPAPPSSGRAPRLLAARPHVDRKKALLLQKMPVA